MKSILNKTKFTVTILLVILISIGYFCNYYKSIHKISDITTLSNFELIEMKLRIRSLYEPFFINNPETISEIVAILSEIRVIPSKDYTKTYALHHKKNYLIQFRENELDPRKSLTIFISNKSHIQINGDSYKVIGQSRIEELYKITIMSQDLNLIDQKYIDLIDVD